MHTLSRNTTLCISLAGRPSDLGTRFHNRLYDELGLDFVYKASTTADLPAAIAGVRALGIRGCSISMPFKEAVIPLVDRMEDSARTIGSVNTIVNDDGFLTASNTDFEAVSALLEQSAMPLDTGVLVRGSGGMAKAVVAALKERGFTRVTIWARNSSTGVALAEHYGYRWSSIASTSADVLVNATPVGMGAASDQRPAFDERLIDRASLVIDAVASPAETPLLAAARRAGITTVSGVEVHAEQAARQFERYTGIAPSADQVRLAAAFARADSMSIAG